MKRYIPENSKGQAKLAKFKSSTVQLIHEAVKDFLLKEDGLSKVFPDVRSNVVGQSHEALKYCCLAYIGIEALAALKNSSRDDAIKSFPFLEYANYRVLYHADQAEDHGVSQPGFPTNFLRRRYMRLDNSLQRHKTCKYTCKISLLYVLDETGMPVLIRAYSDHRPCFEIENERYGVPILAASALRNGTAV